MPRHALARGKSLAAILDDAERGHAVVVTWGGRRIATIGPANASNGAECVALLSANVTDEGFVADVRAAKS